MITEANIILSKEGILAKYPKGSPDYPLHATSCGCSGCAFSWAEWRAGHAAYELGVQAERARAESLPGRRIFEGRLGHENELCSNDAYVVVSEEPLSIAYWQEWVDGLQGKHVRVVIEVIEPTPVEEPQSKLQKSSLKKVDL